jgi:hypothetical protein
MRALLHAITAKSFFILKACGPLRVTGHVTVNDPPPLPREAGSGALGHMATPIPASAGRQGPEP